MKVVINPKYRQARNLIPQLIENFETEGQAIHEGRNVVKSVQTNYGEWIIKQYKRPLLFQRFVYTFFRKSKAERAYLFADKLFSLGIESPEGIAYAEKKEKGLFNTGYFISTTCHYPPLYPILNKANFDKSLAASLAAFFVYMHSKGFLHGDPNLKNILYQKCSEGDIHFSVIDTNRSCFKSRLTQKRCLDNLKRITHHRDLLKCIVNDYANIRNWDAHKCVNIVVKALDHFERRIKIKKIMRGEK